MANNNKNKTDNRAPYSKVMTVKRNIFEKWMTFLNPFFNLTNKEIILVSRMLYYYFEIKKDVYDSKKINQLLFSSEYRAKIKEDLNLRGGYFDVLLTKLRNHNIINENNEINKTIVPEFINGTNIIGLLIYFQEDGEKKQR